MMNSQFQAAIFNKMTPKNQSKGRPIYYNLGLSGQKLYKPYQPWITAEILLGISWGMSGAIGAFLLIFWDTFLILMIFESFFNHSIFQTGGERYFQTIGQRGWKKTRGIFEFL